jgi:hypothetical protein
MRTWIAIVLLAAAQSSFAGSWDLVQVDRALVAVPANWRAFDAPNPRVKLYRSGDGFGFPELDETGEPLQIGLMVETAPSTERTLDEVTRSLGEAAKHAPNLELQRTTVRPLKLADGTDAVLSTMEFTKEGSRRSLQLKLVARDPKGTTWIVSGFLVGGMSSQWPRPDSKIAQWLTGLVTWVTFDSKGFPAPPPDLKSL